MLDNPERLAKSLKYALNQDIPKVGEVRKKLNSILVRIALKIK
jgi:hypothetical protein